MPICIISMQHLYYLLHLCVLCAFLYKSTVMKKMMYYNMRVRTAQRNLAETRLSLMERKKTILELPKESIRTLNRSFKNVGTILE